MNDTETTQDNIPAIFHLAMRSPLGELPIGAAVTLYEGPVTIKDQHVSINGNGRVTFEFVPDMAVRFEVTTDAQINYLNQFDSDFSLTMLNLNRTVQVQILESYQSWPSGEGKITGYLSNAFQHTVLKADGLPESIGRVRFHVTNFQNFVGERLQTAQKIWPGRVQFEFDHWVVTLDALQDLKERQKQIKAQGGLAVTHIGDLRRKDGKLFSAKKAGELLQFLYWFLSFVNGERCGCILSAGLRYLDYPLWEDWSPQITRFRKRDKSWFAKNLPVECLSIAGNFYSMWRDENKRDWVQLAVAIYTDSNSNSSGSDLELTKAQVALEMLCWVVLREESSIVSEDGLERLPAADKIRLLLSMCGIPLTIPSHLADLKEAFRSTPGVDGPQATTEIRNKVVHPSKENRVKLHGYSDMAKYDAWQLNMWYVELVMLKLFKYMGHYDNRLDRTSWQGTYEMVPWAQEQNHTSN